MSIKGNNITFILLIDKAEISLKRVVYANKIRGRTKNKKKLGYEEVMNRQKVLFVGKMYGRAIGKPGGDQERAGHANPVQLWITLTKNKDKYQNNQKINC